MTELGAGVAKVVDLRNTTVAMPEVEVQGARRVTGTLLSIPLIYFFCTLAPLFYSCVIDLSHTQCPETASANLNGSCKQEDLVPAHSPKSRAVKVSRAYRPAPV